MAHKKQSRKKRKKKLRKARRIVVEILIGAASGTVAGLLVDQIEKLIGG